jgi:hypothetical protein
MLISRRHIAGQNHDIQLASRSFENVAKLKYLGTRVTDQNVIREKTKSRLNLSNSVTVQTSYSSSWMLLSSLVISEGVTDLLASYDLFFVPGWKTTAFSYIRFE